MSIYQINTNMVAVQVVVSAQRTSLIKDLLRFHPRGQGWEWLLEFNVALDGYLLDNVYLSVAAQNGTITYGVGDYILFAEGVLGKLNYDPPSRHRLTEEECRRHPLFVREALPASR